MKFIIHSRKFALLAAVIWLVLVHGFNLPGQAQDTGFTVRGKIYSAATGLPLGDINIRAVNSPVEPVSSTEEGTFEITLPDSREQISISYPGYKEQTIFIGGRENIEIWMLREDDRSLGDPAAMTFREIPVRNIPGAVDPGLNIEFGKSPNPSFCQDLQGKISGLDVINRSGMPGEGAYMHARGYSSLCSSSIPLVVVDGMIIESEGFSNPVIHGFHHNPLVDIDKRDISSIVLLKDAVTSGLYGVKGSNGVLLITTTPARGGKTTLDVSVTGGVSALVRKIPVMDADQFSSYVMEQLYNSGMQSTDIFKHYPFLKYDPDYLYKSKYANDTDWQNEVFRTGRLYDAHLTVRGGDARARYSLSSGYLKNESIVNNADYSRFNFRFNSVVQVSSRIDIGFNLGYTSGLYDLMETGATPQTNPVFASLIKSPLLTVYQKDQDGLSLPVYEDVADFGLSNPAVIVNKVEAEDATSKFLGVSYLNLKLTDKLSARAQFGLDKLRANEKVFIPSWGIAPRGDGSAERSMVVQVDQLYSILGECRLSYLNRFHYVHDLSLDAGARYLINNLIQDFGSAQNSATDEFKDLNSGKADEKSVGGTQQRWAWLNYFLSANYILKDRYILSGNLALDASSKFGKEAPGGIKMSGYPFAVLPSAGIAWRISSEPFIRSLRYLDELKVRISYGLTGSDDLANYYTRLYYRTIPYYFITGFTLNGLYNPELKWETVKKGNVGLDLALFRERLILKADWYHSITEDMLTPVSLPEYYGFDSYLTNGGSCRNEGFEISAYGRIIDRSFYWAVDANFSRYRNEVLELESGPVITSFTGGEKITMEGYPMGMFWGYRSLGVFSTKLEADQAGLTDKSGRRFNAGDIHFEDLDQNGTIDERDKTVIGDPHPDYILGVLNQFSYKGLSLDIFIYCVRGVDLFNYLRSQTESMSGLENQSTAIYKRWITDGQVTEIPAASYGDPMENNRFSSRWIEDGSYIRLKSITLSYTFPGKLAFINELNIFFTGTNLITGTGYLGYDPEFSFADGILGQGIDYGKIPQPRTMVVGIKLGL
jgi:TonB-linked SusC/RagA family outer membrane protein